MNKKIIITFMIFAILITGTIINNKLEIKEEQSQNSDESVLDNETAKIQDLKEEYKMTGDNELYEVQTEFDGREVPVIKSGINYKVAFAGLIKKSEPAFNELDEIFEQKYPVQSGIWIEDNSREKILEYLNENLQFQYEIDEEGYLKIKKEQGQTHKDIKIKKLINSEKQYIFSLSSVYYMIDVVTGNVIDNPYEELDRYQIYDYVEDTDKMIIFITQNSNKIYSQEEIFESILDLVQE